MFLLRLNNFSNKIFLPFWASINDDMHTLLSHCRVFVHAFLLSPTYGCFCCYSKLLEFGFIMATRGATMTIMEIDSPTFPVITFIIRGKSRKMKASQSPLEE